MNAAKPGGEFVQKAFLMSGSIVFVLMLGEVAARICLPAPLPWLSPQLRYRPDPALIFTLIPGQHSFSANIPVAINERGLRGPLVSHGSEEGAPRLLMLGDSIVFGYGVTDEETVSSRVQAALLSKNPKTQIVNAGVPSYNTEQEVEFLRTEGLQYHPSWVIVGFCWNDLSDKSGVTVDHNGMLVSAGSAEPGRLQRFMQSKMGYELRNTSKKSRLLYALTMVTGMLGAGGEQGRATSLRAEILDGAPSARVAAGWKRVTVALGRLSDLSKQHDFRVLVVAFPMLLSLEESHPRSSYPRALETIASQHSLDFIDLEPIFKSRYRGRESLFLAYDPDHPNAAGHALAAEAIGSFIMEHTTSDSLQR